MSEHVHSKLTESATRRWHRIRRNHATWLLGALVVTILVHGALLGLFRYAPRPARSVGDRLPPVVLLDLSRPENHWVAAWMEQHDPSLIAVSNRSNGFAAALENQHFRSALDDLPQVPQLLEPRAGRALEPVIPAADAPGRFLVPPWENPGVLAVTPDAVRVLRNGMVDRVLQELLQRNLPDAVLRKRAGRTVWILGGAKDGLAPRLRLAQSSGEAQLDQLVARAIAQLEEDVVGDWGAEIAVDWNPAQIRQLTRSEEFL